MNHNSASWTVACLFACMFFCFDARGTTPSSASTPPQMYAATDVCSVLKNPTLYANKEISLRGSIYMGVDNTNISDRRCPGQALKLSVGDDVYKHADIRAYHKKINKYGHHGVASVA
jgi:hypothetical protein